MGKPKPKVLHVTTVHGPTDVRIFHKMARPLADAGWVVAFATTTDTRDVLSGVERLPLGRRNESRLSRIPRNLRALRFMLGKYDIVHIHDPELLLAAAVARLFGRKVVYDVHEFYHSRFQHDYWMPGFMRPLAAGMYAAVERTVLPRLAGVVVVSEAMVPYYQRFVGQDRVAMVRNFPHITPLELGRYRAAARPMEQSYIVHAGEASRNRMFHIMVRAAELLREKGNSTPIVSLGRIDLPGYGAADAAELLARAKAADVQLLGGVEYDESMRWLAHATAGYLPLRRNERNVSALPIKLFEYFAFGLPVVAAKFGAIERVVSQHQAGLLADFDDAAAHAEALDRVSTDKELAGRLSDAATRASAEYALEAEVARLESLYGLILGVTPNGEPEVAVSQEVGSLDRDNRA